MSILHKAHPRKTGRNHYIVNSIDQLWEMQYDMNSFSEQNSGYKYILTIIDVFSKYAFARPVKSKTGLDVFKAFKDITKNRKPKTIQSDSGNEFRRTLKEKKFKYFSTRGVKYRRYIDALPHIIDRTITQDIPQLKWHRVR